MKSCDCLKTCSWCGTNIPEQERPFGLKTRFHKDIDPGRNGRCVPVSIVHIEKTVAGFARRSGNNGAGVVDLTFHTCSERCAEVLYGAFQRERSLFSARLAG